MNQRAFLLLLGIALGVAAITSGIVEFLHAGRGGERIYLRTGLTSSFFETATRPPTLFRARGLSSTVRVKFSTRGALHFVASAIDQNDEGG